MAKVEIYTTATCPFCRRAKVLLDSKNVRYTEYGVDGDADLRAKMTQRAKGRHTVPQIFINGQHIGGCDDLHALDAAGELDELLKDDKPKNGPAPA